MLPTHKLYYDFVTCIYIVYIQKTRLKTTLKVTFLYLDLPFLQVVDIGQVFRIKTCMRGSRNIGRGRVPSFVMILIRPSFDWWYYSMGFPVRPSVTFFMYKYIFHTVRPKTIKSGQLCHLGGNVSWSKNRSLCTPSGILRLYVFKSCPDDILTF